MGWLRKKFASKGFAVRYLALLTAAIACAAPAITVSATEPDRMACTSPVLTGTACDLFKEIDQLLDHSIIPPEQKKQIWTESKFAALLSKGTPVDAARALLAEFAMSHTGVFTAGETEYYDLLAITQYAFNRPDKKVVDLVGKNYPTYSGIGAWYERRGVSKRYAVRQVLAGSVAESAGLRVGDVIIEADGKPFDPIASFMASANGEVKLKVSRDKKIVVIAVRPVIIDPINFYVDLTKASEKVLTASGKRIGYVRLYSFFRDSDLKYLQDLLTTGDFTDIDALIIDLRGGWGATPISFAQPFVGGLLTQEISGYGGYKRLSYWNFCKPVATIVDSTTRSGKEIFAATLQENGLPLIGETTSGDVLSTKVSVVGDGRTIVELPLADVKIGGRRLEGVGVKPSVPVADASSDDDAVIQASIDALNYSTMRPICSAGKGQGLN